MTNYQITPKPVYTSQNKWEQPMERVEYNPTTGSLDAQEKIVNVDKDGTYVIKPDTGKTLSKVTVVVKTTEDTPAVTGNTETPGTGA